MHIWQACTQKGTGVKSLDSYLLWEPRSHKGYLKSEISTEMPHKLPSIMQLRTIVKGKDQFYMDNYFSLPETNFMKCVKIVLTTMTNNFHFIDLIIGLKMYHNVFF